MVLQNYRSFLDELIKRVVVLGVESHLDYDGLIVKFHYEPVLEIVKKEAWRENNG